METKIRGIGVKNQVTLICKLALVFLFIFSLSKSGFSREANWSGSNGNIKCNTEGRCYVRVGSGGEFRLLVPDDVKGISFKLFSIDKEIKLRILSKALEKKILQDKKIKTDLNSRYTYILNWLKDESNKGRSNEELKADLKKHFSSP